MSMRLARRGGRYPVWAPTVAVGLAGRLRCDARATRAAAMPLAAALNAPLLHGFSPVRRLRRRTAPCVAALLAAPQVAATGYRPPRSTTEVFIDKYLGGAGKAVVGCASAATLCGAEHRRARGRACEARASTSDSRRLFEVLCCCARGQTAEHSRVEVLSGSPNGPSDAQELASQDDEGLGRLEALGLDGTVQRPQRVAVRRGEGGQVQLAPQQRAAALGDVPFALSAPGVVGAWIQAA